MKTIPEPTTRLQNSGACSGHWFPSWTGSTQTTTSDVSKAVCSVSITCLNALTQSNPRRNIQITQTAGEDCTKDPSGHLEVLWVLVREDLPDHSDQAAGVDPRGRAVFHQTT